MKKETSPDAKRLELNLSNNLVSINIVVSAVQPTTKKE